MTAIAARRREAVDRAVHRWAWVTAPIALGVGLALGMSLVTGWYAGEHILSADALRIWVRVPDAEDVLGGPGNQVLNEVAQGGPGFVAVGSDGLAGDEDVPVWVSSDRTWQRVDQQAPLGGHRDQVMNGIVAGPILVAVGRDGSQGDQDAAVWTRPVVDAMGLEDEVDPLVLSFEVGVMKPDPAIYRIVLERIDAEPGRTTFVDDQPAYLAGAAGLGMRAMQIIRPTDPNVPDSDAYEVIQDLWAIVPAG